MAAASFPWFANPWEGVSASDAPVGVPVAVVAVPPDLPDHVDTSDDDDPLALAAALAVDELLLRLRLQPAFAPNLLLVAVC